MHILLVEDDTSLAELIKMFFEAEGYEVDWATDGEQALQLLEHDQFNVILTDIRMPRKDGLDFVRELHRLGHDTPIFVTTGIIDKEVRDKLLDLGVVSVLHKPLSPTQYQELGRSFRSL